MESNWTGGTVRVDDSLDAVWIRDALQREADRHAELARGGFKRAELARNPRSRTRIDNAASSHDVLARTLARYAERFDAIRAAAAEEIAASLRGDS